MSVSLSLLFGTTICGALLCLSWIAWQQKQELDELRIQQRTQELASGNKLAMLEQLTCYDALTGLRNQRMFEDELAAMLRNRTPLALIYIDLDGLKQINTQRGHQVADKVIRSAAKAIRASLQRRTDRKHIYRRSTAADEFLVILERADLATGILLAEQILMSLRMLPTPTTASIGVTEWNGHSHMTTDDLERAAELEMERAKADGRNCVRAPMPPLPPNREPAETESCTVTERIAA